MHVFCKVFFIISLLTIQATFLTYSQDISQQTKSNRKKRFLIFPKGTVIQLVYCYLMAALGTENMFTVGATLGTNWDVPVDLDKLIFDEKMKTKATRREKRSLYPRIEYMLNQLNIDGKSCLKNLLCRSKERLRSPSNAHIQNSFIEEIVHLVFSYPALPEGWYEPVDEYDFILDECENTKNYDNDACVIR
ncbi:uncharacterized protein LOC135840707 [Planococcus citri]|uniref:uncharacterized protein LOC135840707 n=1 Tax=Planococcus citri TaxID=170843 RepID=UPI0031F7A38D